MNDFDHRDLDGRLLEALVAVCEERSITRAAERLQVTQSAVSHSLARLRAILDDPLVVKCGRGIAPTARAEALAARARGVLEALRAIAAPERFDPARVRETITIAANDLQRDLLLPPLLRRLRARAPHLVLRVVPSAVPSAEMLRERHWHLAISPRPPASDEIVQKRLFADRYRVFYDARVREPPRDLAAYLAAEHVSVMYENRRTLEIDRVLAERGLARRFAVWVPGFSGVAPFLRGSALLATLPGMLHAELLREFASCAPPFACPELPMYMLWHVREQHDPLHRWLREELQALVAPALARIGLSAAPGAPPPG
ncbi:MAG: LysR family transcriptional regulator [Burkholderiales bacterium]|nr:LysR family transcriptional regulator [Burkholderiales bacterium]